MNPQLLHLVTLFGLSASVGLNTTLPLLLVGISHDVGLLHLAAPYDALGSPIILLALAILALIEIVGDKLPAIDSLLQTLQTPVTLAAGAVIAGSQAQAVSAVRPEMVIALGVMAAGGTHLARASLRPVAHIATLGLASAPLSLFEDIMAVLLVTVSLVAPLFVPLLLALLLAIWLFIMWLALRALVRLGQVVTKSVGAVAKQVVQGINYRITNSRTYTQRMPALPGRGNYAALPSGTADTTPPAGRDIWDE